MTANELKKIELVGKQRNLVQMQYGAALIGNAAGLIYANKRGSKFWGYVGYMIVGGIIFGGATYMYTSQRISRIQTDIEKLEN